MIPPRTLVTSQKSVDAWRRFHLAKIRGVPVMAGYRVIELPDTIGTDRPRRLLIAHPDTLFVLELVASHYQVETCEGWRAFTEPTYVQVLLASLMDLQRATGQSTVEIEAAIVQAQWV